MLLTQNEELNRKHPLFINCFHNYSLESKKLNRGGSGILGKITVQLQDILHLHGNEAVGVYLVQRCEFFQAGEETGALTARLLC